MSFNKLYRAFLLSRARRHDELARKFRAREKAATPKRQRAQKPPFRNVEPAKADPLSWNSFKEGA